MDDVAAAWTDAGDAAEKFASKEHEIGLICLKGSAKVSTGGESTKINS